MGRKKYSQRKSMIRRPSDNLPVDLRKKDRPFGKLIGKPSPETSPPVSEFESPKLKMIGGFLHTQRTELCNELRSIQVKRTRLKKQREAM